VIQGVEIKGETEIAAAIEGIVNGTICFFALYF
jgi:hypothetical protein